MSEAHAGLEQREWFARLVQQHWPRLLHYATKRGLNIEDAMDAVQDSFVTFLTLPAARDVPREGPGALKLLTTLLRHGLQNARRKNLKRQLESPDLVEVADEVPRNGEAQATQSQELARAETCILQMNEMQQHVVLASIDERPHEDVARALGISPGHVRVLLHRARAHLRRCSGQAHSL